MESKQNSLAAYLANHVNPARVAKPGDLDIIYSQRLLISGIQVDGKML
jgi:hypothetical protein